MVKTKIKDFNLYLPSLGAVVYEIFPKTSNSLANCFADCSYSQGPHTITAL